MRACGAWNICTSCSELSFSAELPQALKTESGLPNRQQVGNSKEAEMLPFTMGKNRSRQNSDAANGPRLSAGKLPPTHAPWQQHGTTHLADICVSKTVFVRQKFKIQDLFGYCIAIRSQ